MLFYMCSIFKKSPKFAGVIYSNSLVLCTGIATVNKKLGTDSFHRLRDEVRRKSPEKRRTNIWFLLHDNAPAHRPVFGQGFIYKEQYDSTGASPLYSSDLSPADISPFPRLKSTLKRQRFCDVTDIIKNATDELERLSKNGFQECF